MGASVIELRVTPWLYLVPIGALGFAVAFTMGFFVGSEADRGWLLPVSICLWIAGVVALSWVVGSRAGIDAAGRLYIRQFGRDRGIDLETLIAVDVQPNRAPHEMRVSAWAFRLLDASGRSVRLPAMTFRDEWQLFRRIASQIEQGPAITIDDTTQAALARVALLPVPPDGKGPGRDRSREWGVVVVRSALAILLSFAGRYFVAEGFRGPDPCDQADRINEPLAQEPDETTPDAVDRPGTELGNWVRLSPYLLASPGPGYEEFSAWGASLIRAAQARHDPDSLALLTEHSFQRGVSRLWHSPQGLRLEHHILEFASPTDAQSFEVHASRYTCDFSNFAWAADLPHAQGGYSTGLGFQVRHRVAAVVEQISWVRGPRRHVLAISLPTVPKHHGVIAELARRASVLDPGLP